MFLRNKNVSAFHLHTLFTVSHISDLLTFFVVYSYVFDLSIVSCVAFNQKFTLSAHSAVLSLSSYMKNLLFAVQHHKIALNIYHKNVSILLKN